MNFTNYESVGEATSRREQQNSNLSSCSSSYNRPQMKNLSVKVNTTERDVGWGESLILNGLLFAFFLISVSSIIASTYVVELAYSGKSVYSEEKWFLNHYIEFGQILVGPIRTGTFKISMFGVVMPSNELSAILIFSVVRSMLLYYIMYTIVSYFSVTLMKMMDFLAKFYLWFVLILQLLFIANFDDAMSVFYLGAFIVCLLFRPRGWFFAYFYFTYSVHSAFLMEHSLVFVKYTNAIGSGETIYRMIMHSFRGAFVGVEPNPGPPKRRFEHYRVYRDQEENVHIAEVPRQQVHRDLIDQQNEVERQMQAGATDAVRELDREEWENQEEEEHPEVVRSKRLAMRLKHIENDEKESRYEYYDSDSPFDFNGDLEFVEPYKEENVDLSVRFNLIYRILVVLICVLASWILVRATAPVMFVLYILEMPLSMFTQYSMLIYLVYYMFLLIIVLMVFVFVRRYGFVDLDRRHLRIHYYLHYDPAIVHEHRVDLRGLDCVTEFASTMHPAPVCRLRRWKLRRVLETNLNTWMTDVVVWRPVHGIIYEKKIKFVEFKQLLPGLDVFGEFIKVSYRPSNIPVDSEQEFLCQDEVLKCLQRNDTSLELEYREAYLKHLPVVKRIDNANYDSSDVYYETAHALISSALSRVMGDVVSHTTSGFWRGVPKQRRLLIRTYTSVYCYGYVVGQLGIPLENLLEVAAKETRPGYTQIYEFVQNSSGFKVALRKCPYPGRREQPFMTVTFKYPSMLQVARHMLRRLPLYLDGYVPPIPDISNAWNKLQGCLKRTARVAANIPQPPVNHNLYRDLRSFTRCILHKYFTPLSPEEDLSFFSWLNNTKNYNQARKKELMDVYLTMKNIQLRTYGKRQAKLFLKTERYNVMKFPRLINAMCDFIKIKLGPASKKMEEKVYELENQMKVKFIKHVPVRRRAKFCQELFSRIAAQYRGTDYKNFETCFTSCYMFCVEFQLYSYMLKYHLEVRVEFYFLMSNNHCYAAYISIRIKSTRMSGEMITSLGNGFSNCINVMFMVKKLGLGLLGGVVEGDDGLFAFSGTPDFTFMNKFGFEVKEVKSNHIGEAGFCGMFFDEEEMVQVNEIKERVASVGWSSSASSLNAGPKRMMELLRAKGLSLLYESAGCPILTELGMAIYRLTEGYEAKFEEDQWWADQVFMDVENRQRLDQTVLDQVARLRNGEFTRTRDFIERTQGISVSQQIQVEEDLKNLTQLGPLRGQIYDLFKGKDVDQWRFFHEGYIDVREKGTPWGA